MYIKLTKKSRQILDLPKAGCLRQVVLGRCSWCQPPRPGRVAVSHSRHRRESPPLPSHRSRDQKQNTFDPACHGAGSEVRGGCVATVEP